jgi:5'(3')-deoxyribonucleotidase
MIFWYQLEWTPDGKEILRTVENFARTNDHEILICTSPCMTAGCMDGKWWWLKSNLPRYYKKVIFCPADKGLLATPNTYLVDDADKNFVSFVEHGGKGVLIPRPWNTFRHMGDPVTSLCNQLINPVGKCDGRPS